MQLFHLLIIYLVAVVQALHDLGILVAKSYSIGQAMSLWLHDEVMWLRHETDDLVASII